MDVGAVRGGLAEGKGEFGHDAAIRKGGCAAAPTTLCTGDIHTCGRAKMSPHHLPVTCSQRSVRLNIPRAIPLGHEACVQYRS